MKGQKFNNVIIIINTKQNKDEGAYKLDHINDHVINQQKVTSSQSVTHSAVSH